MLEPWPSGFSCSQTVHEPFNARAVGNGFPGTREGGARARK